jgi:hypothetical protein
MSSFISASTRGPKVLEGYKKKPGRPPSRSSELVVSCIGDAMDAFFPLHLGHEEVKRLTDAIGRCFDLVPYFTVQAAVFEQVRRRNNAKSEREPQNSTVPDSGARLPVREASRLPAPKTGGAARPSRGGSQRSRSRTK